MSSKGSLQIIIKKLIRIRFTHKMLYFSPLEYLYKQEAQLFQIIFSNITSFSVKDFFVQ